MSTRTAAFPTLGFDPAPGDVGAVTALAGSYAAAGGRVDDAHALMGRATHGAPGWTGAASEEYRAKAGEFPAPLAAAAVALRDAATALDGWAGDLGAMQTHADDLEAQARQAMRRLQHVRAEAESAILPPDPELRGKLIDAARRAVSAAEEELDEIRAAARRLLEQHAELALELARRLKALYDKVFPKGPPQPLDPDALAKIVEWVLDHDRKLDKWVDDNANAINEVSNVIGDLSTYYGAVGFALELIPVTEPMGVAFSTASTVLTGAAFVGHTAAAVHGVQEAKQSAVDDAAGLAAAAIGGEAAGRALGRSRLIAEVLGAATTGAGLRSAGQDLIDGLAGKDSHFQRYWAPRDWSEFAKDELVPGYQVYSAVERAYEIGHAKDVQRR
jgi:hypothetical protein